MEINQEFLLLCSFKIWHYTGTLLYERPWNKQEELWEVIWQSYPNGAFTQKPISYKSVEGIAPSQPQGNNKHTQIKSTHTRLENFWVFLKRKINFYMYTSTARTHAKKIFDFF